MSDKTENTENNILPTDRPQALQTLIKATQSLIDLADREAQALAQNDMMSFNILQEEKTFLAKRYEKLSGEFRERLEEFRGMDRAQIERLEKLQTVLGQKTEANNLVVLSIYNTAQQKTQSSLLTAQELGQQKPVHMPLNGHAKGEQQDSKGV